MQERGMDDPRILGKQESPKPSCASLCLEKETKLNNLLLTAAHGGAGYAEMK